MKKSRKFLLVSLITLVVSCGYSPTKSAQIEYRKLQTQITDDAISKSEGLQELNRLCAAVRLPEGFVFISKGGIDDQKLSLEYSYQSDTGFSDARIVFEKDFANKGWKETDNSDRYPKQLEFTDGAFRIVVSYVSEYSLSNYSVYCEKLK